NHRRWSRPIRVQVSGVGTLAIARKASNGLGSAPSGNLSGRTVILAPMILGASGVFSLITNRRGDHSKVARTIGRPLAGETVVAKMDVEYRVAATGWCNK